MKKPYLIGIVVFVCCLLAFVWYKFTPVTKSGSGLDSIRVNNNLNTLMAAKVVERDSTNAKLDSLLRLKMQQINRVETLIVKPPATIFYATPDSAYYYLKQRAQ